MGLDLFVPRAGRGAAPSLGEVLGRLAAAGQPATVLMVDGALAAPGAAPPPDWSEVRLKLAAGTVTVRRAPDGLRVTVFGNADPALRDAQAQVAAALAAP